MKIIISTVLFVLALATLTTPAEAQRRRKPAPKPKPVKTTVDPVVSAAKQQVATQLNYLKVFIGKIGPIAIGIEKDERDAAAGRLKRDGLALHQTNKKKAVDMIRVLRTALVSLESDFRTKPQLAQYLPKLQGISKLAADSEDSAIAGRFVAAKDPLREVELKLNDTLAVMPGLIAGTATAPVARPAATVPSRTVSNSGTGSSRIVPVSNTQSNPTTMSGEPASGMTPDQVLATSWGKPTSKRTSKTSNGTTEVWTYSGKGTVYFYNGKVSQIVR